MDWEMEKLQISICTLDRLEFKEKVGFYMIECKHYFYRDLTPPQSLSPIRYATLSLPRPA